MREPPPDRFLSDESDFGWFAHPPVDMSDDEAWEGPADGSIIRFMGEDSVDVPLWADEIGLIFNEPEELSEHFRVSRGLVEDIVVWADQWQNPPYDESAFHARGRALVERLNVELDGRFRFVYRG